MRQLYHTVLLIGERVTRDEREALLQRFIEFLTSRGVKEVKLRPLGRKQLAYPIKKNRTAEYMVLEYEAEGEVVTHFTQELRVHPEIIRFSTFLGKAEYEPKEIHHLNGELLLQFVSERGKIRGSRTTRFSAKEQRRLARTIKRARILGILPFTTLAQ